MLQEKLNKVFNIFTDKDNSIDDVFKKPFCINNMLLATNRSIAVAIYLDEELSESDIKAYDVNVIKDSDSQTIQYNRLYKFTGYFDDSNTKIVEHILTAEQIRKALDEAEVVDEVIYSGDDEICPECDGTGEVEWQYEANDREIYYEYHECPICNGTGYIYESEEEHTGRQIPNPDHSVIINRETYISNRIMSQILQTLEACDVDNITIYDLSCDNDGFKINPVKGYITLFDEDKQKEVVLHFLFMPCAPNNLQKIWPSIQV